MTSVSFPASQDDRHGSRRAAGVIRTVNTGFAHHRAGRLDRAETLYRKALEKEPHHAEALHLLGVVSYQRGKFEEAIALIERALPELHDLPEAHLNLGNALRAAGRLAEAVDSYQRAIALDPGYGMAHSNLARALNDQGLFEAGLNSASRAVELISDFLGAHVNCATALWGLDRFAEVEAPLRRALELMPERTDTHFGLGEVLRTLGRFDEAEASYRRALALRPDHAQAHCNLGYVLKLQGKLYEAIACFEGAMALRPDDGDALTAWFREKQNICDWFGYWENEARVRTAIGLDSTTGSPFILLALSSTPAEQFNSVRQVAAKITVRKAALCPCRQAKPGEPIRLGYLSAEFHQHPVAVSIVELIERHDRRHFQVAGYSWGPEDGSTLRRRLAGAFDRFVDIGRLSNRRAAELIHDAVDILVDLTGFTGKSRPAILAHRPAPIQVNYLGYPGTMGAGFLDYIIVDRFLVPADQQPFYSERLVHLPNCYQPSDTRREIAEPAPSRAECGLPVAGFVFCCFNRSYKITPTFFDIWMGLLRAVPGSVLWLFESNALAKENLHREAASRGVSSKRLIFTPHVPMPEYLARLRLADLFLDTLPYNAGATANDALWAGLPVLTCSGETYVGRMAGALLTAIGLPELITTSPAAYADLALRLATEPGLLAGLRRKLARNRSTMPLFDMARFTRDLEAAYTQMWETWQAGLPPTAFSVSGA